MPQFTVTSPDGEEYEVTAPEGATEEEVLARVKAFAVEEPQGMGAPPGSARALTNVIPDAEDIEAIPGQLAQSVKRSIGGLLRAAGEWAEEPVDAIAAAYDIPEDVAALYTPFGSVSRQLGLIDRGVDMASEATEALVEITPENQTYVEKVLSTSAISLGQMAPGMVAGLVLKSPVPMYASMGGFTAGMAYQDARERGLSPETARSHAALSAAIEGTTELIPAKLALKPGGSLTKRLTEFVAAEVGTENVAEVSQLYSELWHGLRDDVSTAELVETIKVTTGAAVLSGGAQRTAADIFHATSKMLQTRAEQMEQDAVEEVHKSGGAAATPVGTLGLSLQEAVATAVNGPKRVGRDIIDRLGAKAISYLDERAKVSPSLRALRHDMEHFDTGDGPSDSPDHFERMHLAQGRYMGQLQEALDKVRTPFLGRVSPEDNDLIVKGLQGGDEKVRSIPERLRPTVRELRKMLDDVRQYAVDAGLEVGFHKNYFPRVVNEYARTEKGQRGLMQVYMRHDIPAETAEEIVRRQTELDQGAVMMDKRAPTERVSLENFVPGRIRQRGGPTRYSNLDFQRKLTRIPDEELAPFMQTNAFDVLSKYILGAVRRAEYARTFGPGEGKLNQTVANAIEESATAGSPMRQAEIDRIYNLADSFQRMHGRIREPRWRKAQRAMQTYQNLRTLRLATLSSLAEPFVVLERSNLRGVGRGVATTIPHIIRGAVRTVMKRVPKAKATQFVEELGIGLDTALSELMFERYGAPASKVNHAFFKAILLHQWTRLNRVFAAQTAKFMIRDHLRDAAAGNARKRQLRELKELGVPLQEGIEWANNGAREDDPFFESVKAGSLRFVNDVVMEPRPSVRPMWHSNEKLALVAQLRGFQTTFGNTVMKRWIRKLLSGGPLSVDRAVMLATGMVMVLTALWANRFREWLDHGEDGDPRYEDEEPWQEILRAVDRAGLTGAFQIAADVLFAHRFGSEGATQALGPTVSQLEGLRQGVAEAVSDGDTEKLKREIIHAVPGPVTNQRKRELYEEHIE